MSENGDLQSAYLAVASILALRVHAAEDTILKLKDESESKIALIACEMVALQLRLICETLLLGSSLAHLNEGDADLKDDKWRPKDAFFELSKVTGHPLPVPIDIELNKNGQGQHHTTPISKPIDFGKLSRVYGVCGDLLHVPTPRQVGRGKLPQFDVALLEAWTLGFKRIAIGHALMLPDLKIILMMTWSGNLQDDPEVFRLDAMGDVEVDMNKYPDFDLLT